MLRYSYRFEIGPTISPCTKGLWVWGSPIKLRNNTCDEEFQVLVIDSEGIGSFSANETHDAQVFALSILLASYFIYNSLGNIDDNAINMLGYVFSLRFVYKITHSILHK